MKNLKIAIIGLGLIGGSLAKAFKEKLNITEIYAVNRSQKSISQALEDKVIKEGFNSLTNSIYECDLIFLCTPIKKTMDFLDQLKGKVKKNCIITDVGSTKSEIVNYANDNAPSVNFIGGHPMAGSEASGYLASYPHLYENAYYVLTPSKNTDLSLVSKMTSLVESIGAIPIVVDSVIHDQVTGTISHFPHIAASALVKLAQSAPNNEFVKQLAAGGFKDITRIASSSPEVWENIITSNSTELKKILNQYVLILNNILQYIDNKDTTSIYNFFEESKKYRDSFSKSRKNRLHPVFDIDINTVDKPGIIGEIASLLGDNQINIKNINVLNSRDYNEGCLKITLSDVNSLDKAVNLLTKKGFKITKSM